MRAGVEMKKGLAEAETGEAAFGGELRQSARLVALQRNVEGELLVQRQRRAADARIVQRAAMAGARRS